jgi:hypothetical protein
MPTSRPRVSDCAHLAALLLPFVSKPTWMRAPLQGQGEGALDRRLVEQHRAMLELLQQELPTMAVTKKCSVQAFESIYSELADTKLRSLTSSEAKDWQLTSASRFRVLLSSWAKLQRKPPKWLKKPAAADSDAECAEGEAAATGSGDSEGGAADDASCATKATDDVFYGYDYEQRLAYREACGTDVRVYCTKFQEPSQVDEVACMVAVWADGEERAVPELLVEDYRVSRGAQPAAAMAAAAKAAPAKPSHTAAASTMAPGSISVKVRSDRHTLVSIFAKADGDKPRQVCQVRADVFSTVDAATEFMHELAGLLRTGEISHGSILQKRDDMLVQRGLVQPKGCKKRPASAELRTPIPQQPEVAEQPQQPEVAEQPQQPEQPPVFTEVPLSLSEVLNWGA